MIDVMHVKYLGECGTSLAQCFFWINRSGKVCVINKTDLTLSIELTILNIL